MRDTPPELACRYHDMLAKLSFGERLEMVADLFATARAVARAGIIADHPGLPEAEIQKRVFLRFYEHALPRSLLEQALDKLDEKYKDAPIPLGAGSTPP